MQKPIVAATVSTAERRFAQAKEEQRGVVQRVSRNGFTRTVCALFWWFCGWWVGATHWRWFGLLIEEPWRHFAMIVERKDPRRREWKVPLRVAHRFDLKILQLMLVQWTELHTIFECTVVHITFNLAWTVRARALKVLMKRCVSMRLVPLNSTETHVWINEMVRTACISALFNLRFLSFQLAFPQCVAC